MSVLRTGRATTCSFGRSCARISGGKAASSLLRTVEIGRGWTKTAPRAGNGGSALISLGHPLPGGSRGRWLDNAAQAGTNNPLLRLTGLMTMLLVALSGSADWGGHDYAAPIIIPASVRRAKSDHPHVWRSYRLLLLCSDRPKTLSLRNPRRSVSAGRESACFLGKLAKTCDPDFVRIAVLKYLVSCVIHSRNSFRLGREAKDITWWHRHITTTAHANHSPEKRLLQCSMPFWHWCSSSRLGVVPAYGCRRGRQLGAPSAAVRRWAFWVPPRQAVAGGSPYRRCR